MGNYVGSEVQPAELESFLQVLREESSMKRRKSKSPTKDAAKQQQCIFYSILKLWSFSPHENDELYVNNQAVRLQHFAEFEQKNSYLILNIFNSTKLNPNDTNDKKPNKSSTKHEKKKRRHIRDLSSSITDNLSPRGQNTCFGGHHAIPLSHQHVKDTSKIKYDIYIWHGREASALIKATALAKVFELDGALKNCDFNGALSDLFCSKDNVISLSQIYDFPPEDSSWTELSASNHLISTITNYFAENCIDTEEGFKVLNSDSPNLHSGSTGNLEIKGKISFSISPSKKKSKSSKSADKKLKPCKNSKSNPSNISSSVGSNIVKPVRGEIKTARKREGLGLDLGDCDKATIRSVSLPPSKISGFSLDLASVSGEVCEPIEKIESKAVKIARFDNICSKITESLYIGSDRIARDLEQLHANGITHVLNCAGTACQNYFPDEFVYKTLYLYDGKEEDIACLFYDVLAFMDAAISGKHSTNGDPGIIFVHCHQGISRSSAMLILYLMWKEEKPFQEMHEFVKGIREICNPNAGFTCQLLEWWSSRSLHLTRPRMFHITPHCKHFAKLIALREVRPTKDSVTPMIAENFDSRGCFLIFNHQFTFIWQGKDCSSEYIIKQFPYETYKVQKYGKAPETFLLEHQGHESEAFKQLFSETEFALMDKVRQRSKYDYLFDLLDYLDNPLPVPFPSIREPIGIGTESLSSKEKKKHRSSKKPKRVRSSSVRS